MVYKTNNNYDSNLKILIKMLTGGEIKVLWGIISVSSCVG